MNVFIYNIAVIRYIKGTQDINIDHKSKTYKKNQWKNRFFREKSIFIGTGRVQE